MVQGLHVLSLSDLATRTNAGYSSICRGEGLPAEATGIKATVPMITEAMCGIEKVFIVFLSLMDTPLQPDSLRVGRSHFMSGFERTFVIQDDGGSK